MAVWYAEFNSFNYIDRNKREEAICGQDLQPTFHSNPTGKREV